jgi:hypothetical protein
MAPSASEQATKVRSFLPSFRSSEAPGDLAAMGRATQLTVLRTPCRRPGQFAPAIGAINQAGRHEVVPSLSSRYHLQARTKPFSRPMKPA